MTHNCNHCLNLAMHERELYCTAELPDAAVHLIETLEVEGPMFRVVPTRAEFGSDASGLYLGPHPDEGRGFDVFEANYCRAWTDAGKALIEEVKP